MNVVITSATEKEIELVKQHINPSYLHDHAAINLSFHTSGIGILASCFSYVKLIYEQRPDLIIQAGIAGSFDEETIPGKVVTIKTEYLADTGVEESGTFNDLFDMNLQQEDAFPFVDRQLVNPNLATVNLLQLNEVTAVTVNEITTRSQRIEQLKHKYHPHIESMEGASLHYCCLQTRTKFIQIRAVSNFAGERNKANWKFKEAFENLSATVLGYVDELYKVSTVL